MEYLIIGLAGFIAGILFALLLGVRSAKGLLIFGILGALFFPVAVLVLTILLSILVFIVLLAIALLLVLGVLFLVSFLLR